MKVKNDHRSKFSNLFLIYHQWFFHHDGQQRFTINFFVYVIVNFLSGSQLFFFSFRDRSLFIEGGAGALLKPKDKVKTADCELKLHFL